MNKYFKVDIVQAKMCDKFSGCGFIHSWIIKTFCPTNDEIQLGGYNMLCFINRFKI